MLTMDMPQFEAKAGTVATLLKALASQRRLMLLCILAERGTASVGELALAVGLSQSALSQHLAKLREDGLVTFDRDGQTLWYRIADPRVGTLLSTLYELYCAPGAAPAQE